MARKRPGFKTSCGKVVDQYEFPLLTQSGHVSWNVRATCGGLGLDFSKAVVILTSTWIGFQHEPIHRLCGYRSRIRGLRVGLTAKRKPSLQRCFARGWRRSGCPSGINPGRSFEDAKYAGRLGLYDSSAAGIIRSPYSLSKRPRCRRYQHPQLYDVYPWQCGRLRQLGDNGQYRLVLR